MRIGPHPIYFIWFQLHPKLFPFPLQFIFVSITWAVLALHFLICSNIKAAHIVWNYESLLPAAALLVLSKETKYIININPHIRHRESLVEQWATEKTKWQRKHFIKYWFCFFKNVNKWKIAPPSGKLWYAIENILKIFLIKFIFKNYLSIKINEPCQNLN